MNTARSSLLALILIFLSQDNLDSVNRLDLETAISKSTQRLKDQAGEYPLQLIFVLDLLNREFGTDFPVHQQKIRLFIKPPTHVRTLLRLMDEKYIASLAQVQATQGINGVIATALHCDVYPPSDDFFLKLDLMAREGKRNLTYSVLAMSFFRQRGCKNASFDYEKKIEQYSKLLIRLINIEGPISDLTLEAIVVLFRSGKRDLVRKDWIRNIIQNQKPNGQFGPNEFSTAWSLWAMLEANRR